MNNTKGKCFSIGEAARMCGVTAKQLRYWQDRKLIPEPQLVVCGKRCFRKYGEDDLEIIRKIKAYLDSGYTLQAAAKKVAAHIVKKEGEQDA